MLIRLFFTTRMYRRNGVLIMNNITGLNNVPTTGYTYTPKAEPRTAETTTSPAVEPDKSSVVQTNKEGDTLEVAKNDTKVDKKEITEKDVQRMIQEAEREARQFTEFITKVMGNQGKNSIIANLGGAGNSNMLDDKAFGATVDSVTALKAGLENGTIQVSQEDIDKARELTSEDGYYGVKKTAGRILDFAKAISGGDPAKAEMLREAVQKGFEQAMEPWGGMEKAPQITKDTYDVVMKGFDEWVNGGATEETGTAPVKPTNPLE